MKTLFSFLVCLCILGCGVPLTKYQSVLNERDELNNKVSRIHDTQVDSTLNSVEQKKAYKTGSTWKHVDGEKYFSKFYSGLGELWVFDSSDGYNGTSIIVNYDKIKGNPQIITKDEIITEKTIKKGGDAKLGVLQLATLEVNSGNYSRFSYSILASTELQIKDLLGFAAYKDTITSLFNTGKKVLLCKGYHVKKIEYLEYDSVSTNVSGNISYISVSGKLYGQKGITHKAWEVEVDLMPLDWFKIDTTSNTKSTYAETFVKGTKDIFSEAKAELYIDKIDFKNIDWNSLKALAGKKTVAKNYEGVLQKMMLDANVQ